MLNDSFITEDSVSVVSKEELLMSKLLRFYSDPMNLRVFVSIAEQGTAISLRLLDWFSTNYSKNNQVYINKIDVHSDYKNVLDGYKKKCFDPFCRKRRIFIYSDTEKVRDFKKKIELKYKYVDNYEEYICHPNGIVTTIGQLNFFKWCMERNIISYIIQNIQTIEKSMSDIACIKKSSKNQKRKKSINNAHKTVMTFTLKFN